MFHCERQGKIISKTYKQLYEAQNWLREHIKRKNRKRIRPDRDKFEDYCIVESETVKVHYL
jgi:hypothetical protein